MVQERYSKTPGASPRLSRAEREAILRKTRTTARYGLVTVLTLFGSGGAVAGALGYYLAR
jgi:hypothetical protein